MQLFPLVRVLLIVKTADYPFKKLLVAAFDHRNYIPRIPTFLTLAETILA